MKTRVYHHPTEGMAVASKQSGVRYVFVNTLNKPPVRFSSWIAAHVFLVSLGYKQN